MIDQYCGNATETNTQEENHDSIGSLHGGDSFWDMNITMVNVLRDKLLQYRHVSGDSEHHNTLDFVIDGESHSKSECIDEMIRLCDSVLRNGVSQDDNTRSVRYSQRLWSIWGVVHTSMTV